MKLISWNMAGRAGSWSYIQDLDTDFALLQEAIKPVNNLAVGLEISPGDWVTGGKDGNRRWRTALVNLSNKFEAVWFQPKPVDCAKPRELAVSRMGTLAAGKVTLPSNEEIILISAYAPWESPHGSTGSRWIYADASAHRVISDLSIFIGHQTRHKVIVAGDLNILFGYGEHGSKYWGSRYETVFSRMTALGLTFKGPQSPYGRMAEPWPEELPKTSKNVPTYFHSQQTPASATRQLDFVFVSNLLSERISVQALNDPVKWGPSDHCIVKIELD